MKSIKDSLQNDINDVELEDDILMKKSKSDKKSKDEAESYKSGLQVRNLRLRTLKLRSFGTRVTWMMGESFLKIIC